MKKIIPVTGFLLCVLMLSGCMNDQYSIEKRYWYAKRQAARIFINPDGSPPFELTKAVNKLYSFSKQYPKTQLAVDADFTIADLFIAKKEYAKARAYLQSMIGKYKSSPVICAEATFVLGKSYEIDDQWGYALQHYKNIMRDYPITPRGLSTPMYMASYYKKKYSPDKMMSAYQDAIAFYKGLSAKYPNTPLAFKVELLVAQCYGALNDWKSAVNTLEDVATTYRRKVRIDDVLMGIATIYKKELKDDFKAKEKLKQIILEYPNGKMSKAAQAILKELEKKNSTGSKKEQ